MYLHKWLKLTTSFGWLTFTNDLETPDDNHFLKSVKKHVLPSSKLTYLWKITIFNGKTHYKWPCSIAMLNYQRVYPLIVLLLVNITIFRTCRPFPRFLSVPCPAGGTLQWGASHENDVSLTGCRQCQDFGISGGNRD